MRLVLFLLLLTTGTLEAREHTLKFNDNNIDISENNGILLRVRAVLDEFNQKYNPDYSFHSTLNPDLNSVEVKIFANYLTKPRYCLMTFPSYEIYNDYFRQYVTNSVNACIWAFEKHRV